MWQAGQLVGLAVPLCVPAEVVTPSVLASLTSLTILPPSLLDGEAEEDERKLLPLRIAKIARSHGLEVDRRVCWRRVESLGSYRSKPARAGGLCPRGGPVERAPNWGQSP